jgi:hypothetical protein
VTPTTLPTPVSTAVGAVEGVAILRSRLVVVAAVPPPTIDRAVNPAVTIMVGMVRLASCFLPMKLISVITTGQPTVI